MKRPKIVARNIKTGRRYFNGEIRKINDAAAEVRSSGRTYLVTLKNVYWV